MKVDKFEDVNKLTHIKVVYFYHLLSFQLTRSYFVSHKDTELCTFKG